jgi:predicted nucleic acid-binding Zn ribbon protein
MSLVSNKPIRVCQECGSALTGMKPGARFCTAKCRLSFNNRRLQRGAELYDLFMAMRYDRAAAQEAGAWSMLCRMAQQMRDDDFRERGGRKSWQPAARVLKDRPDLHAVVVVRAGKRTR